MSAASDEDYEERVRLLEEKLGQARESGQTSNRLHTINHDGEVYTDTRVALHNEIIRGLLDAATAVPADGKAVMAGGIPGAGKTTTLSGSADIDRSRWLMLDPDVIKAEMAGRGMVPPLDGFSPFEAASLAHDESSRITSKLSALALGRRLNVIWDLTMSSEPSTSQRLQDLRQAGYAHVRGIFVDVPIDVARRRADERYRAGQEKWVTGDGPGGRYIPADEFRKLAVGNGTRSPCRATFESLKGAFDEWQMWENGIDGGDPALVEAGPPAR